MLHECLMSILYKMSVYIIVEIEITNKGEAL